MKFGKIYIEWVQFLKKRGLYARYMYEYARTNEYLNIRDALIISGEYYRSEHTRKKARELNHRFLNSRDRIITADKDDSFTFSDLRSGISNLMWYRNNIFDDSRFNWSDLAQEFGEKHNYIEKQENKWDRLDSRHWWIDIPAPEIEVATTAQIADNTRLVNRSRYEDAHAGQWYDRFYNRGRNNNRNNNRWRR